MDKLEEEIKAEMSPLMIGNKRREIQAKRSLELAQAAANYDESVREIIQMEVMAKVTDE